MCYEYLHDDKLNTHVSFKNSNHHLKNLDEHYIKWNVGIVFCQFEFIT